MKSVFENNQVKQIIEPVDMLPMLVNRSVDYIAKQGNSAKPFFLYLPLSSPHTPIVPSKEWQGKSGLGDYADFVMETDSAVGAVLDALDKAGLADNTLVFFTSDNGLLARSESGQTRGTGALRQRQPSRLQSRHLGRWSSVPFFARWPGKIKPASQSSQLICHSDLMATCADMLGVKLSDNAAEDSFSILPALLGTDQAPVHETVIHHSINGSFAIRQGKWKLELCPDSGGWSTPKPGSREANGLPNNQLYDLFADFGETKNLSDKYPDQVERLTNLLEQIITNGRSTPGPKQKNDTKIQMRKGLVKAKAR